MTVVPVNRSAAAVHMALVLAVTAAGCKRQINYNGPCPPSLVLAFVSATTPDAAERWEEGAALAYYGEDFGPEEFYTIRGWDSLTLVRQAEDSSQGRLGHEGTGQARTWTAMTVLLPVGCTNYSGPRCEDPDYVGTYDVFESVYSDPPPIGELTIMEDRADLSYTYSDGDLFEVVFSAQPCDVHGECGP